MQGLQGAPTTGEALDPGDEMARALAEQARINLDGGRLRIEVSGKGLRRNVRAVHVRVRAPEGSSLTAEAGECTAVVGATSTVLAIAGRCHLQVQQAENVTMKAGGQAELQSTSGRVVIKGGGVALDLRAASGGEVLFDTGAGSARVGVVEGTTVQLDLTSGMGELRCDLPLEDGPPKAGADLRLRLRTGSGDVVVSRATADISEGPRGRVPGHKG